MAKHYSNHRRATPYKAILAALLTLSTSMSMASEQARDRAATKPPRDTGSDKKWTTQSGQIQLGPIELPAVEVDARTTESPDIDQTSTWSEYLSKLDPQTKAKYTPPDEYNLNWRVLPGNFCAPAAVANQLVWLDRTAFPKITTEKHSYAAAMQLADLLGRKYMNTMTHPKEDENGWVDIPEGTGTTAHELLGGALRFLKEKKIPVKAVNVVSAVDYNLQGKFNTYGANVHYDIVKPELSDIKAALHRRSIIVTLHGYYEPTNLKDYELPKGPKRATGTGSKDKPPVLWSAPRLERTGGHYTTPVGYNSGSARKIYHHDSAGPDRKMTPRRSIYEWKEVSKKNFATNPPLVIYKKGSSLDQESLRCPWAKQPSQDENGQHWSLECRGSLYGYLATHQTNDAEDFDDHLPGMPFIGLPPTNGLSAKRVKILEAIFEIELQEPAVPLAGSR